MSADDRPIPAAPCPTCQRPPAARSGDVGRVVRCTGCGTRFRIAVSATVAAAPEEDDPPPAPAPRPGNPYDDGYGRFDEQVTPGRVTALATMHFVYSGLLFVRGVLTLVFLRVYPSVVPGPDVAREHRTFADVLSAATAVAAVPLLVAGVKAARRRPTAWGWSLAGLILAAALMLASLVLLALNLSRAPIQAPIGVMCGLLYDSIFWMGYLVPVGVMFGKATAPTEELP